MSTIRTKSIYQVLQSTNLPCAYSHFEKPINPPFIVYIGNGQNTFEADNTIYNAFNNYQVEYYFTRKNEANETAIEQALTGAGYNYAKSEDVYIEENNCFVIYYYV